MAPPAWAAAPVALRAEPGGADELRQDARADRARGGDGGRAGTRRLARAGDRARATSTRLAGCVAEVRDAGLTEVPPGTVTVRVLTSRAVRAFASDNYAPILPEALEAIAAANVGHAIVLRRRRVDRPAARPLRASVFGDRKRSSRCSTAPARTSSGCGRCCGRGRASICAETAHLNVDECGAPEVMGGIKLLTVPDAGRQAHAGAGGLARSCASATSTSCRRGVVSVTQSTELGTLYSLEELRALRDHAHAHGMLFHIDGSRLANAAASLDCSLRRGGRGRRRRSRSAGRRSGCWRPRRSSCSNPELAPSLLYLRKQSMQLASKMRFVSAQLLALLDDDVWRRAAGHANAMAVAARRRRARRRASSRRSRGELASSRSCPRAWPRSSSASSSSTSGTSTPREVRWMCSWDTTEEDVDAFVAAIRDASGEHSRV